MKALFGIVSLLVALAVVGVLAARSIHGTAAVGIASAPAAAPPTAPRAAPLAETATLHEQSQRLQQRVADDVARALEQGAAAREAESRK